MPTDDDVGEIPDNIYAMLIEKSLILTKNELLYLSDSITILMEHDAEPSRIYIPARQLAASASVPVPIELINAIGLGLLIATDPKTVPQEATIQVNMADLYLLRECCQSFIKINNELVGYNLIRKIYGLLLEETMEERNFINKLTTGIDFKLETKPLKSNENNNTRTEEVQNHDTDNTPG